jgi:DNA-binding transcriptional MerR regulator
MHIGKVSELTGATRKAIRHYETIGLIPIPGRRGKYRVYTEKDVMLILLIRRAQAVGFTLNELKQLVAHKARYNKFPLDMANDLIEQKRDALQKEIRRIAGVDEGLKTLREELNRTFGESMSADECKGLAAKSA